MKIRTRIAAAILAGAAVATLVSVETASATTISTEIKSTSLTANLPEGASIGDFVRSLPALDEGDSGYQVLGLQMALRMNGHKEIQGTGYFGPVTRAAVRDIQRANGINPSGHVGVRTWTALTRIQAESGCYGYSSITNPSLVPGETLTRDTDDWAVWAIDSFGNLFDWLYAIERQAPPYWERTTYDQWWVAQVKEIQQRSGIPASGIYGPRTTQAVNFLYAFTTFCNPPPVAP